MKLLIEGALLHLEADIKWLDMIADSKGRRKFTGCGFEMMLNCV
ncbi:hypothetical protein [Virgibacillus indicus]|nr:hypothetical protein [Virgibacillus indicus]